MTKPLGETIMILIIALPIILIENLNKGQRNGNRRRKLVLVETSQAGTHSLPSPSLQRYSLGYAYEKDYKGDSSKRMLDLHSHLVVIHLHQLNAALRSRISNTRSAGVGTDH